MTTSSSISPRELVGRLTPSVRRCLETAIGRAARRKHPSVGPLHLLHQLAADAELDVAYLYQALGRDRQSLVREATDLLDAIPASTCSRPVFDDRLWSLIERADAEGAAGRAWVRSGAILMAAARRPAAFFDTPLPELDAIRDLLDTVAPDACDDSYEAREARGTPPSHDGLLGFLEVVTEAFLERHGRTPGKEDHDRLRVAHIDRDRVLGADDLATWCRLVLAGVRGGHAVVQVLEAADTGVAELRDARRSSATSADERPSLRVVGPEPPEE